MSGSSSARAVASRGPSTARRCSSCTTRREIGHPPAAPAIQLQDGDNYVIVASVAGNPKNPAWYHNLRAHPDDVEIDVRGARRRRLRAREATAEEVAELWPGVTTNYPALQDLRRAH